MSELHFSRHARVRQEQRDITTDKVLQVIQGRERTIHQADCGTRCVYSNDTKVVLSEDNTVITVVQNNRNTDYDVFRQTKAREEGLREKIRRRPFDDNALCSLADLLMRGELGPVNATEALTLWNRAADLGSSHAMFKIAMLYNDGALKEVVNGQSGSSSVTDEAMFWLEKAAERMNRAAMAMFGQKLCIQAYLMPDSEEKSATKEKAMYYLEKASKQGMTRAIYQLAESYQLGFFGGKDDSKAIELYLKAAKTGSPSSLDRLHEYSMKGLFDGEKFEELIDAAIGFYAYSIGLAYDRGVSIYEGRLGRVPMKGLKMLEIAAQRGHVLAMKKLAKCYARSDKFQGDGLKLAQYWYNELFDLLAKSAETGNLNSLWLLGGMHLKGKTGEFSMAKAEKCLREAAEGMNSVERYELLARLYRTGELGNVDPETRKVYIDKAVRLIKETGIESGHRKLARWYLNGDLEETDFIRAFAAESLGTTESSKWVMCLLHLSPKSPFRDYEKGKKIVLELVENGVVCKLSNRVWSMVKQDVKHMATVSDRIVRRRALIFLAEHEKDVDYFHQLLKDDPRDSLSGHYLLFLYARVELPSEYLDTMKAWGDQLRGDFSRLSLKYLHELYTKKVLSADRCELLKTHLCYAGVYEKPRDEHYERLLKEYRDVKERALKELEREICDLQYENLRRPSESFQLMSRVLGDIFKADDRLDDAIKWFEKSSRVNNSIAAYNLGRIYERNKDFCQAIRCFIRGAALGHTEALNSLKGLQYTGHFTDRGFFERFEHRSGVGFSRLANIRNLYGLTNYPKTSDDMYKEAVRRLDQGDDLAAAFWLRKANSDWNHLKASIDLFRLYSSGRMGDRVISVGKFYQFKVFRIISRNLSRATSRNDLMQFHAALNAMPDKKYFRRLRRKVTKLQKKLKGQRITLGQDLNNFNFFMPF